MACIAGYEFDGLDIELFENLLLVRLQCLACCVARRPHEQAQQRLASANARLAARGAAEPYHFLHNIDVEQQIVVLPFRVRLGPARHVDTFGRVGFQFTNEVLVHVFREERYERRHQCCNAREALIQRQVGDVFVLGVGRLPEPAPIAAHVPVAELVDERLDSIACRFGVKIIHGLRAGVYRLVQQCQGPTVDLRSLLDGHMTRKVDVVQPCVQHEKAIGIPERIDKRTCNIRHDIDGDALLHIGRQSREEIPAQCVGADGVEDVVGIDDIAQ